MIYKKRLFFSFRLANERNSYLRNKRLHQEELKSALENQVIYFQRTNTFVFMNLSKIDSK